MDWAEHGKDLHIDRIAICLKCQLKIGKLCDSHTVNNCQHIVSAFCSCVHCCRWQLEVQLSHYMWFVFRWSGHFWEPALGLQQVVWSDAAVAFSASAGLLPLAMGQEPHELRWVLWNVQDIAMHWSLSWWLQLDLASYLQNFVLDILWMAFW